MIQEKPWPPTNVLELVGLTREEWDAMTERVEKEHQGTAIMEVLQASVRRRALDDLKKRTEPYRKPNTN